MLGPRWVRYNQSKLANCAFTAALHERLTACGSSIKALVAHPGFANTNRDVDFTCVVSGNGTVTADVCVVEQGNFVNQDCATASVTVSGL